MINEKGFGDMSHLIRLVIAVKCVICEKFSPYVVDIQHVFVRVSNWSDLLILQNLHPVILKLPEGPDICVSLLPLGCLWVMIVHHLPYHSPPSHTKATMINDYFRSLRGD